jgi:streptogramin lyase
MHETKCDQIKRVDPHNGQIGKLDLQMRHLRVEEINKRTTRIWGTESCSSASLKDKKSSALQNERKKPKLSSPFTQPS